MRDVNIASVDLNLLTVLAAVLEEGSATRAAARLHVTQSAVSNALRRARELFDDPLVVREAHGLSPSPRAAELQPALSAWIADAGRLVAGTPKFDPMTSTRSFSIACTDAVAIMLLPPLLRALRTRAPNVRIRIVTLDRLIGTDGLARGEVDLLVGIPPVVPPGHSAEPLFRDERACLVRRDHPKIGRRLGLDTYAALPHVELALFGSVDDTVDRALARRGRTRTIAVASPHFATIPLALLETDGVATIGRRVARVFAQQMPLRVLRPPLPLDAVAVQQVWHRRTAHEPAALFLRGVVREISS